VYSGRLGLFFEFFVHEPQAHERCRVKELVRNSARYTFHFSSSAATVPSTISSEIVRFAS